MVERTWRSGSEAKRKREVFQSRRWDNDLLTVRQLIAADLLGPITRFESHFDRYLAAPKPGAWRELGAPEEAGGLLFDLGAHLIDQALLLFGQPVSVYAEVEKRRPGVQVDDDTFVALHFAHGVRAHLRYSDRFFSVSVILPLWNEQLLYREVALFLKYVIQVTVIITIHR